VQASQTTPAPNAPTGGQPGAPQGADRIVADGPGAREAHHAPAQIREPAGGIDHRGLAVAQERGERGGEGVDGEVARAQIAVQLRRPEVDEVDGRHPGARAHHPPRAALPVERHEAAAEPVRERAPQRERLDSGGPIRHEP